MFLFNPILNILIFIFLVILITAVINFTNFMDGSDGLVAGCMFVFFGIINYELNSNISIIILLGSLGHLYFGIGIQQKFLWEI